MRHLALVALLAFAPVAARAEPPADAPAVAVAKDQPAPFSGVLVSEPRMVLYLGQQAQLEACTVKLQLRDDALAKALLETKAAADKANERTFIEKYGLPLGVALGLTVGVAGAAVVAVVATRK